jgi:phage tail-like protein
MKLVETSAPSKLLDYLPAIYHDQDFLGAYLTAFERILIGRIDGVRIPASSRGTATADSAQPGVSDATQQSPYNRMQAGAESRSLEETIDLIPVLFDPISTPADFLPWLAGWAALSLRADLDEGAQRGFVANIIQLYRRRGTKGNLIDLLGIFTHTVPEIDEDAAPSDGFKEKFPQFKTDTAPLHFFKVSVWLKDPDPKTEQRQRAIAQSLIEMEKPAHTFYELETKFASMRIGSYDDRGQYRANLEVDTLINVWSKANNDQLEKEAKEAKAVKEKKNAGT